MNTDRRIAVTTGIIFIVATASTIVGSVFRNPLLESPDPLAALAAHPAQAAISGLLSFVVAVTSAGIALSMYPFLKRYDQGLAIGAVGFRIMEGVSYTIGALCLVSLAVRSDALVSVAGQDSSAWQVVGALLLTARDLASFVFAVLAFALGAFLYYYAFYRYQLVPRWLSAWGLIAVVMLVAAVLITLFDGGSPAISGNLIILALPIALQEMVLAVWLIVKGFNVPASPSAAAGS